jgi:hypothetical protein
VNSHPLKETDLAIPSRNPDVSSAFGISHSFSNSISFTSSANSIDATLEVNSDSLFGPTPSIISFQTLSSIPFSPSQHGTFSRVYTSQLSASADGSEFISPSRSSNVDESQSQIRLTHSKEVLSPSSSQTVSDTLKLNSVSPTLQLSNSTPKTPVYTFYLTASAVFDPRAAIPEPQSSSIATLLGSIVGALIGLLLIFGIFVFFWSRRRIVLTMSTPDEMDDVACPDTCFSDPGSYTLDITIADSAADCISLGAFADVFDTGAAGESRYSARLSILESQGSLANCGYGTFFQFARE